MSVISRCLFVLALLVISLLAATKSVQAQVIEEEVSFRSGDITLNGTILKPARSEPGPAIVLVHGAGLGLRDANRAVAEALAQEGFLVLIYDKRTEGYSSAPIGSRSYSLLADDAIAAVQMLQQHDDVDLAQVGLWGLSEGGWVAPLSATRSDDVAFVIAVAGGGIGPAEQTAWATEGELRRQGVTSARSLRALVEHTYCFLVSAELFAEGTYNPVPVLEELQQPILAIWGAEDRIMPAAASARVMQEALMRSGHQHHVLRLIPNASHDIYAVVDGGVGDDFAPGYIELMVSWIRQVTAGNPPGSMVDPLPNDVHPTRPSVMNPQGFARWQVQLGFLIAFTLLFGSYFLSGLARRLRRAAIEPAPGRWIARIVAALGLMIAWGVYLYTGFISATAGELLAAVVSGRPAGWLLLQLLAVVMLLAAILLGFSLVQKRGAMRRLKYSRLVLLFVGAIVFIPWAAWWQLFSL